MLYWILVGFFFAFKRTFSSLYELLNDSSDSIELIVFIVFYFSGITDSFYESFMRQSLPDFFFKLSFFHMFLLRLFAFTFLFLQNIFVLCLLADFNCFDRTSFPFYWYSFDGSFLFLLLLRTSFLFLQFQEIIFPDVFLDEMPPLVYILNSRNKGVIDSISSLFKSL